jgi:branched-chain amino acid transport system permease protein
VAAAICTLALLATLIVPVTQSDSRLEPVVLGGVAVGLATALGMLGARRLLSVGATAALLAGALLLPVSPVGWRLQGPDLAIVMAVAALGLVVLNGWGGQPFLAPLAITGLSAYTVTWVVEGLGQPPITGVCCAMAVALASGLLLGAVCGRRGQAAVAVVSLGLGGVVDAAVFRDRHAGGIRRLAAYDPGPAPLRYYALLALLGVCLLAVVAMRRGGMRLALVAGRAREMGAAVRGVDVAGIRLGAWVTAALLAGAAGCALTLEQGGVGPGPLRLTDSLRLVGVVMVLGRTRIAAALLAGAVCGLAPGVGGSAPVIAGAEPAWLDLVIGTSVVLGLLGRERWRAGHKSLLGLIGPAAARGLGYVTPSHKRGAGFGVMSGDAE